MPYFVVYALDRLDGANIRAAHRDAHRARLREPGDAMVKVHIGGPLLDDLGQMTGSMLVIEAADKATVAAFVKGDPYTQAGLYDTVQITPYQWGLGTPEERADG